MIDKLLEAVFRKRKDIFARGKAHANLKIIFSYDGYQRATSDAKAGIGFDFRDPQHICLGYPFEIDAEQNEPFRLEEI